MEELLRYVASILVDEPDEVVVTSEPGEDGEVRLRLSVRREDVGKVIGKQGRTARAIRNFVQSAAAMHGERIHVQVVDD
ncbi:MAG: hypothetical protein RIT45_2619 [Pseudomonadota bacterium]|jgi:predicted RNA-binding protein YlqC (UPF0109 family)